MIRIRASAMTFHTDRREFLVLAAGGVLAFSRFAPAASPLRIGVIAAPTDDADPRVRAARDGLALGIEEAVRTAGMFRRDVEFIFGTVGSDDPDAGTIAARLLDGGCGALVTVLDGEAALAAARAAASRGRPCVHLVATPPAADDTVGDGALYVVPPAGARAEALLRALQADPRPVRGGAAALVASSDARAELALAVDREVAASESASPLLTGLPRTAVGAPPSGADAIVLAIGDPATAAKALAPLRAAGFTGIALDLFGATEALQADLLPSRVARADLWTPALVRFGAAQLNDRFRARFGADAAMRGPAWAGWFGAKILVETALRTRTPDGAGLDEALRRARFDGHKGAPLAFAPRGHLVQPLHVTGLAGPDSP